MNKNELIDNIINATWIIKMKYPEYMPSRNFYMPIEIIANITVFDDGNREINAMIYYSYWLVLGCTNYE